MFNFRAFLKCDQGATLVEYGLMTAMVGIAAISGLQVLGGGVRSMFGSISQAMAGVETIPVTQAIAGGPVTSATYSYVASTSLSKFLSGANGQLPDYGSYLHYSNSEEGNWDGWTGDFEVADFSTYGVPKLDDPFMIELDTDKNSEISKTFDVEEGKSVKFSMDSILRTSPNAIIGEDGVEVVWNGEVVDTVLPGTMDWQTYDFEFKGGSGDGTNTLTLRSVGQSNSYGALIGNFKTEVETLDAPV